MNRPRSHLSPHDGFFFKETDGSVHRADGWPGVIARVKIYRRRNGFPEGNAEQEVYAQACQREPQLCGEQDGGEYEKHLRTASLKVRVLKWLSSLLRDLQANPNAFVDTGVAQARANICAGCPLNTNLAESCAPCKSAITELRRQILGPNRGVDSRLHNCAVLGVDVGVNVYLDEVRTVNSELPGHCWRKVGGAP